jgi:hypothetical protein
MPIFILYQFIEIQIILFNVAPRTRLQQSILRRNIHLFGVRRLFTVRYGEGNKFTRIITINITAFNF